MRIQRSEFVKSPANFLLQAEDENDVIQLTRYYKRTHVIVPTEELTDAVQRRIQEDGDHAWPTAKTFYVYDSEWNLVPKDGDPHQLIGVKLTVAPFYAGEQWQMEADAEKRAGKPDATNLRVSRHTAEKPHGGASLKEEIRSIR